MTHFRWVSSDDHGVSLSSGLDGRMSNTRKGEDGSTGVPGGGDGLAKIKFVPRVWPEGKKVFRVGWNWIRERERETLTRLSEEPCQCRRGGGGHGGRSGRHCG
jgi:hypothetical protein